MNSTIERLLTLRVSDVMSRNVVSIAATKSMANAAEILTQHFISGAPVIGHQGQCVGILSATDFVRCVANSQENRSTSNDQIEKRNGVAASRHACPAPATDLVASHMSALVQTVNIDQPLTEAARLMCQNHIHRVVDLDAQGRPAGVLTSLDMVAALINAIEE
jgi:predicted transcriptional regulator